jgi:hypothetical protein
VAVFSMYDNKEGVKWWLKFLQHTPAQINNEEPE